MEEGAAPPAVQDTPRDGALALRLLGLLFAAVMIILQTMTLKEASEARRMAEEASLGASSATRSADDALRAATRACEAVGNLPGANYRQYC